MAGFKVPRYVEFLDELPLNATGQGGEGPTPLTSVDPHSHSLVIASDYRVPDPEQVWPLLKRRRSALAGIGAHHVLLYTSTHDYGRVLVTIGVRSREPIVELLRSRVFFDWFDAVGVDDIPAVFAGEIVERFGSIDPSARSAPGVVVAAISAVDDVPSLTHEIRGALTEIRDGGHPGNPAVPGFR